MSPRLCKRRETCRACASRDLELVLPLTPTPSASQFLRPGHLEPSPLFPLDVALCHGCGLVQLLDTVDPSFLYAQSWERTSRDSPGMREHFRDLAKSLDVQPGQFVVEIGSNDGALLGFVQEQGARVLGIDPGVEASAEATAAGIETIQADFTSALAKCIREERRPADLIIANNVLANMDDLADVAEGIRTLLSPTGMFVFETGYVGDLVANCVFDNIYHEHLSYFSVAALEKLFSAHGLYLYNVERVNTKGGSLRGFVGHRRRIGGILPEDACLTTAAPYQALGAKLQHLKCVLHDLFVSIYEPVGAFGASLSVVTLLHHFDLLHRLEFVVDDNPVKHGWKVPGTDCFVGAPHDVRTAPWTLILPWRFAPMIRAAHPEYQGRWIIPVPEVTIV